MKQSVILTVKADSFWSTFISFAG